MRGDAPAVGDIKSPSVSDWLVTGWFTPDYRPLAEKLSANLAQHGAPYHLWAKPKAASGWNTWWKPSAVIEAMEAHPGKTVVLMDTDCIVRDDISPIIAFAGDVSLTMKARLMRVFPGFHKRTVIKTSSRVVVFRPTEGARAFAEEWQRLVKSASYGGDEPSMLWAFLNRQDVAYHNLDPRYAGDEAGNTVTDAVIYHYGAHGRRNGSVVKNALKQIERRYFRTGRSQMSKRAWREG
jgi:hypothetical protein